MNNSKFVCIIITILTVVLSYFFYNPRIDASSLFTEFKDYVGFTFLFFSIPKSVEKAKNEKNNGHYSALKETLFSALELRKFTGSNNGNIYLSILGKVFDVTKGKKYYGPGENYHGFAGKDASKAFITGDFTEQGLVEDISDLSLNELGDLHEWVKKYEKDYIYKGKLIGRFYDETGQPTKFLKEIEDKMSLLYDSKSKDDFYKKNYPPCNAEWTPETGSRVWCSRHSGGIKRDWIGFPRKFHQPGTGVSRCACINLKNEEGKKGNFEVYKNCDPHTVSCYVK